MPIADRESIKQKPTVIEKLMLRDYMRAWCARGPLHGILTLLRSIQLSSPWSESRLLLVVVADEAAVYEVGGPGDIGSIVGGEE
jgi:hypothetical protein